MNKWGFWNVRGLNKTSRVCDVLCFIKQHNIGLFGLLETRVKARKFAGVFPKFGGDWSVITNYSKHRGGRIWVIWMPGVFHVDVRRVEGQLIHLVARHIASGCSFDYTIVYGLNEASQRMELWDDLISISRNIHGPWMIGGDFNNVLNLGDRVGSPVTLVELEQFRECLKDCNLMDWKTEGLFFTWNNKQDGVSRVCSRIDRVAVNSVWQDSFLDVQAKFYAEGDMDHSPCVINFASMVRSSRKPFRFYNMWIDSPEFFSSVQEAKSSDVHGTEIFKVVKKLKSVKQALKDLNLTHFTDVEVDDAEAHKKLVEIQGQVNDEPGSLDLIKLEIEARKADDTAGFEFLK
ncbi:uncharacterized protein LOC110729930 [Chenopodium quinoa]|uniref:uncharacterized protein LOC110729930 n=1 Tax=Chenopodium quinoa TaxID=63459 RepID=UPI000B76DC9B|nr:uncharacterized protein LOC110729930 [Chenopodium quinoa]